MVSGKQLLECQKSICVLADDFLRQLLRYASVVCVGAEFSAVNRVKPRLTVGDDFAVKRLTYGAFWRSLKHQALD